MDLKQKKLSKSEWEGIEIPVHKTELDVLRMVVGGYHDVNIRINKHDSIFTYLKMEFNTQIEEFLYAKLFADKIKQLVAKYKIEFIHFEPKKSSSAEDTDCYITVGSIVKLKSGDQIRMSRLTFEDTSQYQHMYEFILYDQLEKMITLKFATNTALQWMHHYYTLHKLLKNHVEKVNTHLLSVITTCLRKFEPDLDLFYILMNSQFIIERNPLLLKYTDLTLYEHQKQIYTLAAAKTPKLVLYIAPTNTGKTITPLGLSEGHKIIFVCAARHVGLALARSAISVGKRIAFAFGVSASADVRLHYFAAKVYTTNKRSGKIEKVDNEVGDRVEIIICDIRSYLHAMHYMASFNPLDQIITYWDEPTITMDYSNHELHKIIKKNWKENIIPNMILSSATLPKLHELTETVADFKVKFPNALVSNIVSNDCRKSIPLLNNNGFIVMPHYLSCNYHDILAIVEHCEDNLTLLRHFDLQEATNFLVYVETNSLQTATATFERNFESIEDIDMRRIKQFYLKVLKHIKSGSEQWPVIYDYFNAIRRPYLHPNLSVDLKGNKIRTTDSTLSNGLDGSCGVYVTTKDAYTLTDGPTIFIASDLAKIAKFYIQQSNIPASVMKDIMAKIEYNNQINERIDEIEKELEFEEEKIAAKLNGSSGDKSKEAKKLLGKKDKSGKKIANKIVDKSGDRKLSNMKEDIASLKSAIKTATLDDMFIPNRLLHLEKWASGQNTSHSFTSDIDEDTVASIMMLTNVDDSWKILLLLGIGVFTQHKSIAYTEIMKKLADQQKLYLIIADSDYIYGTNYAFCHGYLSKDLQLTQEKIIQAMGRIGRNNIQQEYSIRFRYDEHINCLFRKIESENKPEVINMNQLFHSKNIRWNGFMYEELPEEAVENYAFNDDDDDVEEEDVVGTATAAAYSDDDDDDDAEDNNNDN